MRRTHLLVSAACVAGAVVALLISLGSDDGALGLALAGILFANALVRFRLARRS